MEDQIYKKIEMYLGGDMLPEDVIIFEKEIEENSELKKEVTLYNQLNHHLGHKTLNEKTPDTNYTHTLKTFLGSEEATQIKNELEVAKQHYLKKASFFSRYKNRVLSSAAVILLLIAIRVVWWSPNLDVETLYSEYYSANDLPSLVQRSDSENTLYIGIEAFKNQDYKKALTIFENYETSETEVNYSLFLYKGITYSELNNLDAAIKAFDVVTHSKTLDNSKGLWFEALTYLKFKDEVNAKKTLETISLNASNFKFKDAQTLLKKL